MTFEFLAELEAVLRDRRGDPVAGSYSASLMTQPRLAGRKLVEEAVEVCLEIVEAQVDRQRLVVEAADLLFHLMAALTAAGVDLAEVVDELERRRAAG